MSKAVIVPCKPASPLTFMSTLQGKSCFLSYAGSGLPQAPFRKTISTPLKLGKKWGFRENPEMGFDPLLHPKTHFGPTFAAHWQKPILNPTSSGNKLFSKKGPEAALTQHSSWAPEHLHSCFARDQLQSIRSVVKLHFCTLFFDLHWCADANSDVRLIRASRKASHR